MTSGAEMWPEQRARTHALCMVIEHTKRMGAGGPFRAGEAEIGLLPDDIVRMAEWIMTGKHEALGTLTTVELGENGGLKYTTAENSGAVGLIIDPKAFAQHMDEIHHENDQLREHNAALVEHAANQAQTLQQVEAKLEELYQGKNQEWADHVEESLKIGNNTDHGYLYAAPLGTSPEDRDAWISIGATESGFAMQGYTGVIPFTDGVHFRVAESKDDQSPMELVFEGNSEQFQAWLDAGSPQPEFVDGDTMEQPTVQVQPGETEALNVLSSGATVPEGTASHTAQDFQTRMGREPSWEARDE